MALNPLRAVEACYAAVVDDRAWARGLLAALAPLGQRAGIHAVRFERGPRNAWEGTLLASSAAQPDDFATWLKEALQLTGCCEVLLGTPGPVGLLSRAVAAARRSKAKAIWALLRSARAEDLLVIRGDDDAGVTLVIAVPITSADAIRARTVWQLGRFAEHLSSALRLRRCVLPATLAGGPVTVARPKTGYVAVAVQREAHRFGRPAAPRETEALWEGLVNGSWSAIDHSYEAGSFVLLLRQGGGHDPRALTPREREVLSYVIQGRSNKEIAYELEIGSTTVGTHLRIAERKLGGLTRRALIAALGARPGDGSPRPRPVYAKTPFFP